MVNLCSVKGCESKSNRHYTQSFFKFPRNEEKRRKWCAALNLNFKTTNCRKVVCSDHFSPDQLNENENTRRTRVRPNAIPSLKPSVTVTLPSSKPSEDYEDVKPCSTLLPSLLVSTVLGTTSSQSSTAWAGKLTIKKFSECEWNSPKPSITTFTTITPTTPCVTPSLDRSPVTSVLTLSPKPNEIPDGDEMCSIMPWRLRSLPVSVQIPTGFTSTSQIRSIKMFGEAGCCIKPNQIKCLKKQTTRTKLTRNKSAVATTSAALENVEPTRSSYNLQEASGREAAETLLAISLKENWKSSTPPSVEALPTATLSLQPEPTKSNFKSAPVPIEGVNPSTPLSTSTTSNLKYYIRQLKSSRQRYSRLRKSLSSINTLPNNLIPQTKLKEIINNTFKVGPLATLIWNQWMMCANRSTATKHYSKEDKKYAMTLFEEFGSVGYSKLRSLLGLRLPSPCSMRRMLQRIASQQQEEKPNDQLPLLEAPTLPPSLSTTDSVTAQVDDVVQIPSTTSVESEAISIVNDGDDLPPSTTKNKSRSRTRKIFKCLEVNCCMTFKSTSNLKRHVKRRNHMVGISVTTITAKPQTHKTKEYSKEFQSSSYLKRLVNIHRKTIKDRLKKGSGSNAASLRKKIGSQRNNNKDRLASRRKKNVYPARNTAAGQEIKGITKVKCPRPGCEKVFTHLSNMMRHLKNRNIHINEAEPEHREEVELLDVSARSIGS